MNNSDDLGNVLPFPVPPNEPKFALKPEHAMAILNGAQKISKLFHDVSEDKYKIEDYTDDQIMMLYRAEKCCNSKNIPKKNMLPMFDPRLTVHQLSILLIALRDKCDISIIANPELDANLMEQLYYALNEGIDKKTVKSMAKPGYDYLNIPPLVEIIKVGGDITNLLDKDFSFPQLEVLYHANRFCKEEGIELDIDYIADPAMPAWLMNEVFGEMIKEHALKVKKERNGQIKEDAASIAWKVLNGDIKF